MDGFKFPNRKISAQQRNLIFLCVSLLCVCFSLCHTYSTVVATLDASNFVFFSFCHDYNSPPTIIAFQLLISRRLCSTGANHANILAGFGLSVDICFPQWLIEIYSTTFLALLVQTLIFSRLGTETYRTDRYSIDLNSTDLDLDA